LGTAGLDAGSTAKALAEKELLERGDRKHLSKVLRVPGCGMQRLFHVKAGILEAG
jgi:hypothetical protein